MSTRIPLVNPVLGGCGPPACKNPLCHRASMKRIDGGVTRRRTPPQLPFPWGNCCNSTGANPLVASPVLSARTSGAYTPRRRLNRSSSRTDRSQCWCRHQDPREPRPAWKLKVIVFSATCGATHGQESPGCGYASGFNGIVESWDQALESRSMAKKAAQTVPANSLCSSR